MAFTRGVCANLVFDDEVSAMFGLEKHDCLVLGRMI